MNWYHWARVLLFGMTRAALVLSYHFPLLSPSFSLCFYSSTMQCVTLKVTDCRYETGAISNIMAKPWLISSSLCLKLWSTFPKWQQRHLFRCGMRWRWMQHTVAYSAADPNTGCGHSQSERSQYWTEQAKEGLACLANADRQTYPKYDMRETDSSRLFVQKKRKKAFKCVIINLKYIYTCLVSWVSWYMVVPV